MKAYFSSLFEPIQWRLMSGSPAWLAAPIVLALCLGLAAGSAMATERVVSKRLRVDPAPATAQQVQQPTVFDELLNIVTRMTTQTERVVSKRL